MNCVNLPLIFIAVQVNEVANFGNSERFLRDNYGYLFYSNSALFLAYERTPDTSDTFGAFRKVVCSECRTRDLGIIGLNGRYLC